MKKTFWICLTIFLGLILAVVSFVFNFDSGKIRIRNEARPLVRNFIPIVEKFIYSEAEKHNPSGDFLPDNLDDEIKKELKEKLW